MVALGAMSSSSEESRSKLMTRLGEALAKNETLGKRSVKKRVALPNHETTADPVETFVELATDYRARVRKIRSAAVLSTLVAELTRDGISGVALSLGTMELLGHPATLGLAKVTQDLPTLSFAQLGEINASITTATSASATTGSLLLNSTAGDGRRALSLVVDFHYCLLRASQVCSSFADALALCEPSRAITVISGPSATSDIELSRVEGVHGPRHLCILLLEDQ